MSKRFTLSYSSVFLLSFTFMMVSVVYFLFTIHTRWQDWTGSNQSKRLSLLNQAFDGKGSSKRGQELDENASTGSNMSKTPDDGIKWENLQNRTVQENKISHKNGSSATRDTVQKNTTDTVIEKKPKNGTTCAEDKIYVSNEFYDCDGIMKDANDPKQTKDGEIKPKEEELVVPGRIKQKTPALLSQNANNSDEKARDNIKTDSEKNKPGKRTNITRNIFVNCGGTFPWPIELFLDTYPNASTYQIFTFLHEPSYKIMYSLFPNHTVITSEASYVNRTQNVDIKSFGSDSEVTQTKVQTDLAAWLQTNTKQSDYVILRLESKEEIKVLKHLTESKAIEHIDKFYTSLGVDVSKTDMDAVQTILNQHNLTAGIWTSLSQTYLDFDVLNPKHIPTSGKYITMCKQIKDEEKFALFLFSPSASVNSLKVIDLLQRFSPEDRLQLAVFLPYQTFKSGFVNMEKLFEAFHVGMYYDWDEFQTSSDVKFQYNLLKAELTFGRSLFHQHDKVLQYVLVGQNTSNETIAKIQENLHYSVIQGGTDITNMTSKTLTGQAVSIDDTGKRSGDFLLVNIDAPNTEYLVLYMLRRFAPWLLNLSDCDVYNAGDLLPSKNAVNL